MGVGSHRVLGAGAVDGLSNKSPDVFLQAHFSRVGNLARTVSAISSTRDPVVVIPKLKLYNALIGGALCCAYTFVQAPCAPLILVTGLVNQRKKRVSHMWRQP